MWFDGLGRWTTGEQHFQNFLFICFAESFVWMERSIRWEAMCLLREKMKTALPLWPKSSTSLTKVSITFLVLEFWKEKKWHLFHSGTYLGKILFSCGMHAMISKDGLAWLNSLVPFGSKGLPWQMDIYTRIKGIHHLPVCGIRNHTPVTCLLITISSSPVSRSFIIMSLIYFHFYCWAFGFGFFL